ncbi:kynurenine formamidase [Halyomorpha halys]|uniref:kynurenine formamidase n=1 Tax=Halyomorpha halys TaxID=286706 RepID=UPI0006D4F709|nr:uncharacterized protein LOC106680148 [Halyomorpha halys]
MQMLLFMLFILSSASAKQLVDLSYPYDENTAYWFTEIPFRFIKKVADSSKGFWFALNQFETAEHSGTHLDAPYHFNKAGWKLGDIPIERFITTGVFLDASSVTNGNCSYKLSPEELDKWQSQNGQFPDNSVLLVSFGWASRYKNKADYFGPADKPCFPGLSKEAAEWITKSKKIVGVGLDTPSIDQGLNFDAHIELNSKNLYMLENVAIAEPLPKIFKIIVLPIKIREGTGGPVRIVAIT